MIYPTISEYIESIKYAEDNFATLTNLRPVLDDDGNPIMSSGNFAVVFKMKDEQAGKMYAVKCFLREQEGRNEAYHMIAEELEHVSSTYLTPIKYLKRELFVNTSASNETEFPVLIMDWVDGITLDKYIREHINDRYKLSLLTYQFSMLAKWLIAQHFAHGDLKPDNILVRDVGLLVLVDYDGMYVPAMKGQKARELGSPNFRHPSRSIYDFNEHIDDFSLTLILLSIKIFILSPKLLDTYSTKDCLLFTERDLIDISNSIILKKMFPSNKEELNIAYSLFLLAYSKVPLDVNLLQPLVDSIGNKLCIRAEAYCRGSKVRILKYWNLVFEDDELPIEGISNDGDKEQAYNFFHDLALVGHEKAQCCLGCLLWDKLYRGAKREESIYWYSLSASNGNKKAINDLSGHGITLFENSKNSVDDKDAFRLFKIAANYGNQDSIGMLSFCYDNGLGTLKDSRKAVELYESITDGDILYRIGRYYFQGIRTEINYHKALKLFNKSISYDKRSAYAYIALCYYLGLGTTRDIAMADIYFEQAHHRFKDIVSYYFEKEQFSLCAFLVKKWLSSYSDEELNITEEKRSRNLHQAFRFKASLEELGYEITLDR